MISGRNLVWEINQSSPELVVTAIGKFDKKSATAMAALKTISDFSYALCSSDPVRARSVEIYLNQKFLGKAGTFKQLRGKIEGISLDRFEEKVDKLFQKLINNKFLSSMIKELKKLEEVEIFPLTILLEEVGKHKFEIEEQQNQQDKLQKNLIELNARISQKNPEAIRTCVDQFKEEDYDLLPESLTLPLAVNLNDIKKILPKFQRYQELKNKTSEPIPKILAEPVPEVKKPAKPKLEVKKPEIKKTYFEMISDWFDSMRQFFVKLMLNIKSSLSKYF